MTWDRVHTVNEYYDGPRLGIADVAGVPHIYEAEFDHNSDEYGDTYFVAPVDAGLLSLVLEEWEIWLRWESAYKRSEISLESHPALPQDRERHEVLMIAIGDRLRVDRTQARYLKARFERSHQDSGMLVEWYPAEIGKPI